jgi:DNA mismatch repair protein MutS
MPRPVVERARELLRHLEDQGSDFKLPIAAPLTPASPKQKAKEDAGQMRMFHEPVNPAVESLRTLEVDNLSPLEALTKLYELKRMAGN